MAVRPSITAKIRAYSRRDECVGPEPGKIRSSKPVLDPPATHAVQLSLQVCLRAHLQDRGAAACGPRCPDGACGAHPITRPGPVIAAPSTGPSSSPDPSWLCVWTRVGGQAGAFRVRTPMLDGTPAPATEQRTSGVKDEEAMPAIEEKPIMMQSTRLGRGGHG
jgi:hypothetical protein